VPDADPLIGRVIAGKMELLEVLGSGAMGKVYRARHRGLDKMVAIKVLHPEAVASPSIAGRFKAEARAASKLDHPNSLQILDFGEDGPDKLLYLAMEILEGDTLQSLLQRERRLTPQRAAWIMGQVCSALAAAHDRGVVHRDVKPANVMLTVKRGDEGLVSDWVKVCDFGLAKLLDSGSESSSSGPLTQQGMVLGTPAYMSPEQAKGETVDHRSDVYSCGVILYRMLSGQKPFSGDSAWAVSLKQIAEAPPPIRSIAPEISEALAAVVHRAMEKDPNARFQSARELKAQLAEAAGVELDSHDGSVSAFREATVELDPTYVQRPEPSLELSAALGKRERKRSLAVAGALFFALAGAVAFFSTRTPSMEAAPLPLEPPKVEPPPIAQVAIRIAGAPDGARVLANGVLLGVLPDELAIAKGDRSITLRFEADGHEPLERSVLPMKDVELTVALKPLEAPPPRAEKRRPPPPTRKKKIEKKRTDRHSLENPFE
jgi:serine/threonine-protein kinase